MTRDNGAADKPPYLRDAIATTLKHEIWTVKIAGLTDAEALHLADAVIVKLEDLGIWE